jgi:hypothetical protein
LQIPKSILLRDKHDMGRYTMQPTECIDQTNTSNASLEERLPPHEIWRSGPFSIIDR